MGKINNTFVAFLYMFLFVILFFGCSAEKEIVKVEINEYNYKQDISEFDISNLTLKVMYYDGTYDNVSINKNMISYEDNFKLQTCGKHKIEVIYNEIKVMLNIELTDYYEVKYIIDSEVINKQIIEHGGNSTHPDIDIREGYIFSGWDNDGKNIIEDTVITGTYVLNKYKVVYMIDEEIIESQLINYGEDSINPEIPNKEGYIFSGWDIDGKNITKDTVIKGTYVINKYNVDFVMDGKIIESQTIEHGKDCILPEVNIEGYIFKGWDDNAQSIVENKVINAIFDREKFNVQYYGREDVLISQIRDEYGFNEPIVIETFSYINAEVEVLVNDCKLSKIDNETSLEYCFDMPKQDVLIEIRLNIIDENEKIYRIDRNNRVNLIEQNLTAPFSYEVHFDYLSYPTFVAPEGVGFETENELREEYNKNKEQYYKEKNLELIKELGLEIYLEKYNSIGKIAYFTFEINDLTLELKHTFKSIKANSNVSKVSIKFNSNLNKAIIDINYLGFSDKNVLDYSNANLEISDLFLIEKDIYDSYEKLCMELDRLIKENSNSSQNQIELIKNAYSRFDEEFFEKNVLIYCGNSYSAFGNDKHYITNVFVKDGKISVVVEIDYASGGTLNVHEENHIIIINKDDFKKNNIKEVEVLYIYTISFE